MSGLEKIIDQILTEAREQADQTVANAQAQADEIRVRGAEKAEQMRNQAEDDDKKAIENYRSRMNSAKDLKRRTRVLESRQKTIAELIEKAYKKVCAADVDTYFSFMEKVIAANVMPEQGEIYFSQKDLNRMPKGFELKIKEAAQKKGGDLTLRKEPGKIENGCILVYGGIEENCTVKALFDAKKDHMTDLIYRMLYA